MFVCPLEISQEKFTTNQTEKETCLEGNNHHIGSWQFELGDAEYFRFLDLFLGYLLERELPVSGQLACEDPLMSSQSEHLREAAMRQASKSKMANNSGINQNDNAFMVTGLHPVLLQIWNDLKDQGGVHAENIIANKVEVDISLDRQDQTVRVAGFQQWGSQVLFKVNGCRKKEDTLQDGLFEMKRRTQLLFNKDSAGKLLAFPESLFLKFLDAFAKQTRNKVSGLQELKQGSSGRLITWLVQWANGRGLMNDCSLSTRGSQKCKRNGTVMRINTSAQSIICGLWLQSGGSNDRLTQQAARCNDELLSLTEPEPALLQGDRQADETSDTDTDTDSARPGLHLQELATPIRQCRKIQTEFVDNLITDNPEYINSHGELMEDHDEIENEEDLQNVFDEEEKERAKWMQVASTKMDNDLGFKSGQTPRGKQQYEIWNCEKQKAQHIIQQSERCRKQEVAEQIVMKNCVKVRTEDRITQLKGMKKSMQKGDDLKNQLLPESSGRLLKETVKETASNETEIVPYGISGENNLMADGASVEAGPTIRDKLESELCQFAQTFASHLWQKAPPPTPVLLQPTIIRGQSPVWGIDANQNELPLLRLNKPGPPFPAWLSNKEMKHSLLSRSVSHAGAPSYLNVASNYSKSSHEPARQSLSLTAHHKYSSPDIGSNMKMNRGGTFTQIDAPAWPIPMSCEGVTREDRNLPGVNPQRTAPYKPYLQFSSADPHSPIAGTTSVHQLHEKLNPAPTSPPFLLHVSLAKANREVECFRPPSSPRLLPRHEVMAFHDQVVLNQDKPLLGDVSPVILKSLQKVDMRRKERQRQRAICQKDFSKKEKHSVFFNPTVSINNSSETMPQRSCEEILHSKRGTRPGLSNQSLQNAREQGTSRTSAELHYLASTWQHPTRTSTLCVDASSQTVSVKNKETSTESTVLDSPPRDSDHQHTTTLDLSVQEEPKEILSSAVILNFSLPEPSVSMTVPMSPSSQKFLHVADIGADCLADLPLTEVTNKSADLSSPLPLSCSLLCHSNASSPTTPYHSLASPSAAQRNSTMLPPTILHSLTSTSATLCTSTTSTPATLYTSTTSTPATLYTSTTSTPARSHSSTVSTPARRHSSRASPPAMWHTSTASTPALQHSLRTSPVVLHSSTSPPHATPQKSKACSTPFVAPNEDCKGLCDVRRVITQSENHKLLGVGDFDWKLQQDEARCILPDEADALLCPLANSGELSQVSSLLQDMDTRLTALQCAADGMHQDLHSSRMLVHKLEELEKMLPPKNSCPAHISHQAGGYVENWRPSSDPPAAGGLTPGLSLSLSDVSSITPHSHKPISSNSREVYAENKRFNGLSDIISDMVEDESKDASRLDLVHSSHHASSSTLPDTLPFQTSSPENRSPAEQQELRAWMRRKRCEHMAEFHRKRSVLLEQEHKPFVPQASTTAKEREWFQQDKGERDRHRLVKSSRVRTMQAGELLLELMKNHVGKTPAPPSSATISSGAAPHKRSKPPLTSSRNLYPAHTVQNDVSRARSASCGEVHPGSVPKMSHVLSTSEFKHGGTCTKLAQLDGVKKLGKNGKSNLQGAVNKSDEDINESELSDWIVPENIRCILMETESSRPAVSAPSSPNETDLQSPRAQHSNSTTSSVSQIDWESVDNFIAGLEDS
uniref:Uncharacterized protein n=1 Tax=Eptatretus burgeri TaxID=7764 RepID=A0A8C4R7H5_EPTBU